MHMAWERLALAYAILLPPVFVAIISVRIRLHASAPGHVFRPDGVVIIASYREEDGHDHLRHACKLDRARHPEGEELATPTGRCKGSSQAYERRDQIIYLTMGDFDTVVILEAPDDAVAARFSLQLGMLGNVRTRTLKAFAEAAYREIINSLG